MNKISFLMMKNYMDIEKLKKQAIEQIQNMPHIKPDRVDSQLTKVEINKQWRFFAH